MRRLICAQSAAPGSLARQSAVVHVAAQDVHVLGLTRGLGEGLEVLAKQLTNEALIHI